MAMAMPEVTEGEYHGHRTWSVRSKSFAWVRPFSKADVRRFGTAPVPAGPIVAVRVADLAAKEVVLAEGARGVFTIPHFDGYAAVLLQLDVVAASVAKRRLDDAWLACAPPASLDRGRAVTPSRRAKPEPEPEPEPESKPKPNPKPATLRRFAAARGTRTSGRGTGR